MNKYPWILAEVLDKLTASNSVSRYIDRRLKKSMVFCSSLLKFIYQTHRERRMQPPKH